MSVISLSHVHKGFEGQRLTKEVRLVVRISIAIILVCLPLAHGLNSLQLIATTTCLVAFVLAVDVWGSTDQRQTFWRCSRTGNYSADCRLKRKSIVDALKKGEKIELKGRDLVNVEEKGMY